MTSIFSALPPQGADIHARKSGPVPYTAPEHQHFGASLNTAGDAFSLTHNVGFSGGGKTPQPKEKSQVQPRPRSGPKPGPRFGGPPTEDPKKTLATEQQRRGVGDPKRGSAKFGEGLTHPHAEQPFVLSPAVPRFGVDGPKMVAAKKAAADDADAQRKAKQAAANVTPQRKAANDARKG